MLLGFKAIETAYNGYMFRSRLEARWAVYFDAIGLEWEYEPEGFDLEDMAGRSVKFLPDFWLPQVHSWAEVKPMSLTREERRKVHLLVRHTAKKCILLVGIPSVKSYADVVPGDIKSCSEDDCCGGAVTEFDDECGAVISMFHGYPIDEHRFYGSPGWGGEISIEQAISEGFEDVVEAVHAARSARFEHGQTPTTLK